MCTSLVSYEPDAPWPLLVAFVRDEDRDRPTDPPGAWWPDQPTLIGGRDQRGGGTWLTVDVGDDVATPGTVAFVQNQIGPHVSLPDASASPSRGQLPLRALEQHPQPFDPARLPELARYQPFHLVVARFESPDRHAVDWWQWNGDCLEHAALQPGIHLVASRGVGLPGERERRARLLERFAAIPTPEPDLELAPDEAWGEWLRLLDGRDAKPGDFGGLVVHSVAERPGFGTVGATLVGIAADGRVRYDRNATTTLDPDGWDRVSISTAGAAVTG